MIRLVPFFIVCLFLWTSSAAQAQDAVPTWERFGFKDDSTRKGQVANENPEGFTAPPKHWRGFSIYARSDVEEAYDDNIYSIEESEDEDFITRIKPSIAVGKNVGRHQFLWQGEGEINRYADHSDENHTDLSTRFRGRLEAYRSFIIPFEIAYGIYHVDRDKQRGSTLQGLTKKPIEYKQLSAETGFRYQPNRFALLVMARGSQTRYEDGELNSGAPSISTDGDHDSHEVEMRLSYETKTSLVPYLEAKMGRDDFLHRDYIAGSGFTGDARDNDYVLARAGVSLDYKGLVTGFISAGQERRTYDQANIDDTSSFSLASALQFILDPKWTVNVNSGISTAEDSIVKAGIKKRRFGIGLNYELQQDLFATLGVDYQEDEFTSIVRDDETWEVGGGLRYILSPRLQLSAEYLNRARDSTAINGDLDNHIMILRLTGSL